MIDAYDLHPGWPVPADWPRGTHPAPHLERLRKEFAGAEALRAEALRRVRENRARAKARRP